jgi:hypothetical protein
MAAYIEVHIEQGPRLIEVGSSLGSVRTEDIGSRVALLQFMSTRPK